MLNKKINFILSVLMLIVSSLFGQKLTLNPGVDTLDLGNRKAVKFISDYMAAAQNGLSIKSYWPLNDKYSKSEKTIDLAQFAITNFSLYKMATNRTILSIENLNGIYAIKTIHNWLSSDTITTCCITDHYVDLSGQHPIFRYPQEIINTKWTVHQLRNVNFIHPVDLTFNKKNAKRLLQSIKMLEKDWNLKPLEINYYYSNSYKDINSLRGIDYMVGQNQKPSGITFAKVGLIFCQGLKEDYFHEFVHAYLDSLPNKDMEEGLAIFYGGALGISLKDHVASARALLKLKSNLKFTFENDNYATTVSGISMNRLIPAVLMAKIYQTHGLSGIKRIMNYPDFKTTIQMEFSGQTPDSFTKFVHQMVDEYVDPVYPLKVHE